MTLPCSTKWSFEIVLTITNQRHEQVALWMSTLAFTVCFAAWVLNAVLVTWLSRTGVMPLDDTQLGWLLAVPILTGALSRVPLGIATDRFGVVAVLVVGEHRACHRPCAASMPARNVLAPTPLL